MSVSMSVLVGMCKGHEWECGEGVRMYGSDGRVAVRERGA